MTSSCNIRHVCKHKLSDKSPGHRLVTVTLAAHKAHVTPPVEKIRNQWALCITWKTTLWDIKSRTLTYCRRYLQMHFLDENQEFDSNEIYSRQSNFSWLQVNTCLDNGVVPNRRQAIIAPMMTHFIIACMRHRASKCWHIDKRIENLSFYERIFTKYFLVWTPRHVSAYLTLLPPPPLYISHWHNQRRFVPCRYTFPLLDRWKMIVPTKCRSVVYLTKETMTV